VFAQADTCSIDPSNSFVHFELMYFGASTSRGRFDKKEGSITFDRSGKTGKVEPNISTDSVSTGVAVFDARLRQDDLLASGPCPEAVANSLRFEGDSLAKSAAISR